MNVLDIILIVPLIFAAWAGYRKGFVIEIASLAALILGIYAAINFSFYAAELLDQNFDMSEKWVNIIAFIITFVVVVFVIYVIGRIIEKFIDILMLGFVNRLFGLVFGVLKWAFILSILIYIVQLFDDDNKLLTPKLEEGSALYRPIQSFAPYIIPKLNIETFRNYTRPYEKELENV